jgi:hypothetical protein
MSLPAPLVPAFVTLLGGCSLVLDFSDGAIPADAATDSAFSEAECDFGEPNDSIETAMPITASDVGPAAICERLPGVQDRDFYRFTVPENTATVSVKITFVSSARGDLDLRLYDKTGATLLGMSVGFMDVEEIVCPGVSPDCNQNMPLPPDDYIFEVFSPVSGANRYDIALMLTPE